MTEALYQETADGHTPLHVCLERLREGRPVLQAALALIQAAMRSGSIIESAENSEPGPARPDPTWPGPARPDQM